MIQVRRSKDNQWYYIVKARNGKVLVVSETFKQKKSVLKSIRALKKSVDSDLIEFVKWQSFSQKK